MTTSQNNTNPAQLTIAAVTETVLHNRAGEVSGYRYTATTAEGEKVIARKKAGRRYTWAVYYETRRTTPIYARDPKNPEGAWLPTGEYKIENIWTFHAREDLARKAAANSSGRPQVLPIVPDIEELESELETVLRSQAELQSQAAGEAAAFGDGPAGSAEDAERLGRIASNLQAQIEAHPDYEEHRAAREAEALNRPQPQEIDLSSDPLADCPM